MINPVLGGIKLHIAVNEKFHNAIHFNVCYLAGVVVQLSKCLAQPFKYLK